MTSQARTNLSLSLLPAHTMFSIKLIHSPPRNKASDFFYMFSIHFYIILHYIILIILYIFKNIFSSH